MIEEIVDALAKATPPKPLFNQYTKSCKLDLHPKEAAELRRERLLQHLSCTPRIILLSGHADISTELTGIALTSEELVAQGRIPRVMEEQITNGRASMTSWKASVLWGELERAKLADKTILWNVQPFFSGKPIIERNEELELNFGLQFLQPLLKHFFGVPIIVRNGVARHALELLEIRPAATLPALTKEEESGQAIRKALGFLIDQPKHGRTRNAGKPVRDFFASCRGNNTESKKNDN